MLEIAPESSGSNIVGPQRAIAGQGIAEHVRWTFNRQPKGRVLTSCVVHERASGSHNKPESISVGSIADQRRSSRARQANSNSRVYIGGVSANHAPVANDPKSASRIRGGVRIPDDGAITADFHANYAVLVKSHP